MADAPAIFVLAGTNGAGKSSVGGAAIAAAGAAFYNPDVAARKIQAQHPRLSLSEANGRAWSEGKRLLETAIARRLDFAFETTLGGATMKDLLVQAARAGFEVHVWFAGLATPELHIARVAARVKKGGHPISEADVRRRFDSSRKNLIELLPHLTELRVYDNSDENDPSKGDAPSPRLVLHWKAGRIEGPADVTATPGWAKPIVQAALKLAQR